MNEGLRVINNNCASEVGVSVANSKQGVYAIIHLGLDIIRIGINDSSTVLA